MRTGLSNPLRAFRQRPRLLGALAVTLVLALALPFDSLWTRLLLAWCLGVALYLGLVFQRAVTAPRRVLLREASALDDSALVVLLFAILATAASFGGIFMLIFGGEEQGAPRIAHLSLAVATMIGSWLFVQVVFAIHYAHLYYGEGADGARRGGLDFNGDEAPDFWDFLYFSVTIGATSQTSDTAITAKLMRRVAILQTIYAYFFNTSVLAFAINMAASFVEK